MTQIEPKGRRIGQTLRQARHLVEPTNKGEKVAVPSNERHFKRLCKMVTQLGGNPEMLERIEP